MGRGRGENRRPSRGEAAQLYEFFAQDIDGNYFRVFHDFAWEERGDARL